jgi:asparagine synthase (glutamine-hydrolysing)
MCGIAGWLGHQTDKEQLTACMLKALYHRGPDGNGIKSWPEASLIHTRLSIIDLSPAGAQPMANEDRTIWSVFNGEIYNHRELRHSLEARGHVFRGRSDSEILPHLYEEEGIDFVAKLRGMFAFAIYDTRRRALFLARDRFGIKPLFYAPMPHRLAFASEIPGLLELPDIDKEPDRQAIYDFAALFYIPAPETFYTGIRALQPGELLEAQWDVQRISWRTRSYHQWSITPDPGITLDEAVDRSEALVTAAVRRQMESDVPIGALLSGGIDSSLISAVAQQGSRGLRTFNVRFPEKDFDETWAAVAVANHIGSRHTTLDMDGGQGTWERVKELLLHTGQPFADVSLFAVNAICRLMRRSVTVALSGDGGDEVFGGYDTYWRLGRIARWQALPAPVRYRVAIALSPFGRYGGHLGRRIEELAGADDTSVIQSQYCWLGSQEHAALCHDTGLLPIRRFFEPQWEYHLPAKASRLERLSAHATEVSIRLTLANDYLFKVDTASMKEGLEVRVPMLDEDLVAFGLCLPHRLKVNGRTCKRVLRAVAQRRLPTAVAKKPKWGFGVPLETWLDPDFKECLRDALLGPSSKLPGFFRPQAYTNIVKAVCEGTSVFETPQRALYVRAIMLLSAQLTLARNEYSSKLYTF